MKIAHISDIHLDKNCKRKNYYRTLQLLEYIADNNFDHVIISGDLTENAESSAFELARKTLNRFGLLDPKKLTLTIGNHDIFGGVHLAEDVINFPAKCRLTDYDTKVRGFEKYFAETFTKTIRPIIHNPFPFIKEFDDFILISLNSIARYNMIKNPFASNGEISDEQLKSLGKLFGKNDFNGKHKIAIVHHHFCKDVLEEESSSNSLWQVIERQTMKLRRKKYLIRQLKKMGIELVLHGHLHETIQYHRKGIKFINAGGAILGTQPNLLKVNRLLISKDEIQNEFLYIPAIDPETSNLNESLFPKISYQKSRFPREFSLN